MKLGLSLLFGLSRPLKHSLAILEAAVELGVEVVELVDEGPHRLDKRRLELARRVLNALGLEVAVHGPFVDMNIGSPHEPTRRFVLKRHFKSMEAASQLGAVAWVFHPGLLTGLNHFFPGIEWRQSLKSVRELAGKAKELGLSIFLENGPEPVPFLLKRARDFEEFLSELGSGAEIGLAFDVGHAYLCGQGQVDAFTKAPLADKIGHVHIHDNDGRADLHLALGSGVVGWAEAVKKLRAAGYSCLLYTSPSPRD